MLLVSGDVARPTARFPDSSGVACGLAPVVDGTFESQHDTLPAAIDCLYTAGSLTPEECRQQPWHPFVLEWRVDVHPHAAARNEYDPSFIGKQSRLAPDGVDFELEHPGPGAFALEERQSVRGTRHPHGLRQGAARLQLESS